MATAADQCLTGIEDRLNKGYASEKDRYERAARDGRPLSSETTTFWISRQHRVRRAAWEDAVGRAVTRSENGHYPAGVTLERRTTWRHDQPDAVILVTLAVPTEWSYVSPEQQAEYEMQREVQKAERDVATIDRARDYTNKRLEAYAVLRDALTDAIRAMWERTLQLRGNSGARDLERRVRVIAGQLQRDVTYFTPGTTDEDAAYLGQTLTQARGLGVMEAAHAQTRLNEWASARRYERYYWDEVHNLPDEDEAIDWASEIPGWDAPVGTKEWLDGCSAFIARRKQAA